MYMLYVYGYVRWKVGAEQYLEYWYVLFCYVKVLDHVYCFIVHTKVFKVYQLHI